jgi:hypothetical protein
MRNQYSRPVAAALVAALALTSINIVPAQAASGNSRQPHAAQAQATTSDFSARRRHYRRGNAAALGAVLGVFGAIASIAAADQYRNNYYYGDPGYGAYGAPYGYAPAYRFGGYWHHRHHHWR